MYEVEIKFPVNDPDTLRRRFDGLGIVFGEPVEEIDRFYRHPSRDFAQTDEALRIRRRVLPDGEERCFLTYKGPKIDADTKTRRELERPLDGPDQWDAILAALGFEPGGVVRKFRCCGETLFQGRRFAILLDWLPDLERRGGGHWIELETLAPEAELEDARAAMFALAETLGLSGAIRTSYLGLLDLQKNDPIS